MDESVEEGSGGDDDRAGENAAAIAELESNDLFPPAAIFFGEQYVDDFGLLDEEAGLRLEHLAHLYAVLLLVALRAGRPHGGATRSIQQAELNADGVSDLTHDSAERIDFANEIPWQCRRWLGCRTSAR